MNALELKEILEGFTDLELQDKTVGVLLLDDNDNSGDTIIAESVHFDDDGDIIITV